VSDWTLVVLTVAHGLACLWVSRHVHPDHPKWTAKGVVVIGVIYLVLAAAMVGKILIGGAK